MGPDVELGEDFKVTIINVFKEERKLCQKN